MNSLEPIRNAELHDFIQSLHMADVAFHPDLGLLRLAFTFDR